MMPSATTAAVAAAAVALVWTCRRVGLFNKVTVEETVYKGGKFAVKVHTIEYKDVGPCFGEVSKLVHKSVPLVGVYLDKPGTVPPGKTRCAVGAILQDAQNLYADDDSRSLLSKKGYEVHDIPAIKCVHTVLPHSGFVSIMVAIFVKKVYEKLEQAVIRLKKYEGDAIVPCFEIYGKGQCHYYMPLDQTETTSASTLWFGQDCGSVYISRQ